MNTVDIYSSIASKKRKGFALVLALIVVGIGLIIVAFMFNSVSSFTKYFSEYRQVYVDTVTARSYIEKVKGDIVAANNRRSGLGESVLHGVENQDPEFNSDITNLSGLLISSDEGDFSINDPIAVNGPQRVEVLVYDANYKVEGLIAGFPHDEIYELPPSFYAEGQSSAAWREIGDSGYDYNKDDESEQLKGAYEKYGAYLIRVKIFDTANRAEKLVRTTEEAFLQVIP